MQSLNLIIEVTGVPLVGKTSLLNDTIGKLKGAYILFSDEIITEDLKGFRKTILSNRWFRNIFLFFFMVQGIEKYICLALCSFSIIFKMGYPLNIKVYLWGNVLLKLGRYEYALKNLSGNYIIFDEGLSHIPFNLINYGKGHLPDVERIYYLMRRILKGIYLIVIDDDGIDIKERLSWRGHKRLFDKEKRDIKLFINFNRRIKKDIVRKGNHFFKDLKVISARDPESESELYDELIKVTSCE